MQTRNVPAVLVVVCLWLSLTHAQTPQASTPRELGRIAGWRGASPKSGDGFTFVVVSDRTGGHAKGQWAAAIRQVNLLQPDFVMSVGDLIEGYTEDAAKLTSQWEEFEALTKKFDAPFFYCPGNHDVANDKKLASNVMRNIFLKRHGVGGKTYYSFGYRGCHFIVLDSSGILQRPGLAEEQLAWLAKDVAAAKDARHIFVFYHHPLWQDEKISARLHKLLQPGKTTIFHGHRHSLWLQWPEGIPSYTLGSTCAQYGGRGLGVDPARDRALGLFRMFAHVNVDAGKPTIALIPLNEVLPASYASLPPKVMMLVSGVGKAVIPAEGGQWSYQLSNPFGWPVVVEAEWDTGVWDIAPAATKFTLPPGATVVKRFAIKPKRFSGPLPQLTTVYRFFNPHIQAETSVTRKITVPAYAKMDIPRLSGLKVDGESKDFASLRPLRIGDAGRVFANQSGWYGPEDNSFELRLATDGERLFAAVEVADDQIRIQHTSWQNDSLQFFWATTPKAPPTAGQSERTNWVRLVVPAEGVQPTPIWPPSVWPPEKHPSPKGFQAVCKRRPGGYVYKWSIPLSELGVNMPLKAGQTILLDVVCSDRDIVEGAPSVSRMSTSGVGDSESATTGYIRCTFK